MMGILDFIFGDKKKLPISKVFRFDRVTSEISIKIGDDVSIWNKPNTYQINLYANGSVAGRGLIGMADNKILAYHLSDPEYLFVENKIIDISANSIDLYVHIYRNKKAVLQGRENQRQKWLEQITKKYKPTSTWELRFFADNPINTTSIQVKTVEKDEVDKFYEKKDKSIWLVDDNQDIIQAENRIRQGGTEKTLRSVYSGHKIIITNIKKDHPWYYLTVGIESIDT